MIRIRIAALAAALALPATAGAQSLLDRPPNLSGNWVGNRGTLYFNFLHRFSASDAPVRKVSNVPTFTVAAGLGYRTMLGFHYATNSALAPAYPNEWEFWARHQLLSQDGGGPVDLGGQVGYNLAAEGVDGEVSVARRFGGVRIVTAARVLSDAVEAGETRFALAGGATLRLNRYFALAGDVAALTNRVEGEEVAWSAGLHLAIPLTPHTLSLQASNTNAYTLQGMSRGEESVRYGFEFTIPLTLSRWFGANAGGGHGAAPVPPPPAGPATPSADASAAEAAGTLQRAGMRNMAFAAPRMEVAVGTTVEW
ncbi:MAG TPA: hypothetical protein VEQ60_01735, partial [Longimicrobium sp.]|nr:hypothetical protein [Longimicrobium sp.]